jgi:hypothetical protein
MDHLREHLRRHNRWVLGLTFVTLAAAVLLWGTLYLAVYWLFLLGGTAAAPLEFHPNAGPLTRGFAATAILLCLFAWIARRVHPDESARDHKGLGGHLLDLLLAIPRVTLAIFGTSAAAARLNDRELEEAWFLLQRMKDAGGRLPMQALPVDIPDPRARKHIILALQLSSLIDILPTASGPVLTFKNEQARFLAEEKVRLRF